jgi:phosphoserine phosphatase RsbU/P
MAEPSTILVIEDEPQIRFSIVAYLEDSGFTCLEAKDGVEGLDVFAKSRPDVVMTDLRMPRLDGFGVLIALRQISPATPVIVITGSGAQSAAEEAKALGAKACFFKPLNEMERLVVAIRSLIKP